MKQLYYLLLFTVAHLFAIQALAQPTLQTAAFPDEYSLLDKKELKTKRCGTHHYMEHINQQYPSYAKQVQNTFDQAKGKIVTMFNKSNDSTLRIPVVVHIVHFNELQNLPDSVIEAQIRVLNEDFNRKNEDTSATRDIFRPVAASANIEFYLATTAPDGSPTTGITRTNTAVNGFMEPIGLLTGDLSSLERVKSTANGGIDPWPLDKYLNIWVCDLAFSIFGGEPTPSLLGIATPPLEAPNWPAELAELGLIDGVVLHYQIFGPNNPAAQTLPAEFQGVVDRGRTATHEVGHYLGLRHIGGDAADPIFGGDGCSEDDGIADTPNANGQSQQDCSYTKNSCVDEPIDHPDMIENYMDYSNEYCMNMFSQGQVEIMRAMLTGPRAGLLTEQTPEIIQVVADFSVSDTLVIALADTVTFTDLSTGEATTWFWNFGDGTTSTEQHPTHVYENAGDFTVTLIVDNGQTVDTITLENYVSVSFSVGINAEIIAQYIKVIPNPATSYLEIILPKKSVLPTKIILYNAVGEQVKAIKQPNFKQQVEVSDLPNGLYFTTIFINNEKVVKKVMIQR